MNQQHRFAGARDFELELRSVDARSLHGFAAHCCRPFRMNFRFANMHR